MNVQETLPTELRMSAPPSIPQARSYMFKQRSEYTEYNMNKSTKIRINIPRLQRTYLSKDSYLRFRLNVDVTAAVGLTPSAPVYLDRCGAYSLFDRLEVYDYMGGTLIEQVNNIPALMTMRRDLLNGVQDFNGKLQSVQGYEGSYVGVTSASPTPNDSYELRTGNSGIELFPFNWNNSADAITRYQSFEFAIPLPSFLGMFSTKFIPLHNGFSIDLFLNNVNQAFISYGTLSTGGGTVDIPENNLQATKVTSAWISNAELCSQVMELGNEAENLVLNSNGSGPLVIPSTFYRYFTNLVKGSGEADQTSTVGMDLNLNVVSLKNIRFAMRPAYYQNNINYPAYGHRIRNFLENFSFQYGSSYLPELAGVACRSSVIPNTKTAGSSFVTGSSEAAKMEGYKQAYAELMKTGGRDQWWAETTNPSINQSEFQTDLKYYNNNGATTATKQAYITTYADMVPKSAGGPTRDYVVPPLGKFAPLISGKFMGGLDLRLSSKDVVSGIDTNGLLVRLNARFDDNNLSNMINAVLDVFAEHDAFVQIIPGVASTVTF